MLLALEDLKGDDPSPEPPPVWLINRFRPDLLAPLLASPSPTALPTANPVVNHGRWIVRCPSCPGAELASRGDHRFVCCSCGNRATGGGWLPVMWPAAAALIEQILLLRPDPDTQNWESNETTDDLLAENVANGIPVPA